MAMKMEDIQLLTDDQLYATLLKFSSQIGPIVDSTRSVYQTMLFNKLIEREEKALLDSIGEVEGIPQKSAITKAVEENPRRSVSQLRSDEPPPSATPPHTFKRWDTEEDDPFQSPMFDDALSFRSRTSLSARPRLYDPPAAQPAKKPCSILKTVLLIGFVFVLAAFILLVVTQSPDPYQDIVAEATKFAGKVGGEAVA